MAKEYYIIRDFSKGINNLKDPRDLEPNESFMIQNMSVESKGKLKTAGGFYGHGVGNDGTLTIGNGKYIADRGGASADLINIEGSGGYGLFYFESDHSLDYDQDLSFRTSDGTDTNNEVAFYNPSTAASSGFASSTPTASEETDSGGTSGGTN